MIRRKKPTTQKPEVLLIDGLNMCYRAAFTLGRLKHGDSSTGVIYGCLNMLRKLVVDFSPKQVFVVWEGRGSRERREAIFPAYKAGRKQTLPFPKEDLYAQVDALKELLYYLGISCVEVAKFEADDIIAVLSRHFVAERKGSLIVSTDKDLWQLINAYVTVWSPSKEVLITESNFREVAGIDLSDYVDYKSLIGDASDNIPGVSGIGEKGALEVCDFFGLQAFLALKADEVKSAKLKHLLTPEGQKEFQIAKQLIDLSTVPITTQEVLDKVTTGCYDSEELRDLLLDYEMWSILDDWDSFRKDFENATSE